MLTQIQLFQRLEVLVLMAELVILWQNFLTLDLIQLIKLE